MDAKGADIRRRSCKSCYTFQEKAIRCLRELENPNLKGLLRRIVGKIFNDVEIKGWCKEQEHSKVYADSSASYS